MLIVRWARVPLSVVVVVTLPFRCVVR